MQLTGAEILQLSVTIGAVGVAWANLSSKVNHIQENMDFNFQTLKKWLGTVLDTLVEHEGIPRSEAKRLSENLHIKFTASGNPISQEEADKLKKYFEMAKAGTDFTPEQAKDFKQLSERYAADPEIRKKEDWDSLAGLVVLGALIFSMFAVASLSGKKK